MLTLATEKFAPVAWQQCSNDHKGTQPDVNLVRNGAKTRLWWNYLMINSIIFLSYSALLTEIPVSTRLLTLYRRNSIFFI